MFRQSCVISNLILVSLIAFASCETLQSERRSVMTQDQLDAICTADYIKNSKDKSWKNDCNSCWCVKEGLAGCEKKGCEGGAAIAVSALTENHAKCPQGSNTPDWKEDCNSCSCVSSPAVPACTRKMCEPKKTKRDTRAQEEKVQALQRERRQTMNQTQLDAVCTEEYLKIAPEEYWQNDCNFCWCVKVGMAACEKKNCEGGGQFSIDDKRPTTNDAKCPQGKETPSWKEDCNSCFCVSSPAVAVCTRKMCEPKKAKRDTTAQETVEVLQRQRRQTMNQAQLNAVCTADYIAKNPEEKWQNECNSCWCIETGIAACTRKSCEGGAHVISENTPTVNDPKCPKGNDTPTWKEDCNSCWCVANPSVSVCTRKACEPKKTKRDTKNQEEMIKSFAEEGEPMMGDGRYLPSAANHELPSVWTATAALSLITALLARM